MSEHTGQPSVVGEPSVQDSGLSRSQRSGFSSVHPTVCGSLELVALPQPLVRARAASCAPACRAACVERAQAHTAPSTHTHTHTHLSTPRHPPPEIRWSHLGISAAFVLQNPHRPPPCLAQFQGNSPCFASSKSKVSLLSSASWRRHSSRTHELAVLRTVTVFPPPAFPRPPPARPPPARPLRLAGRLPIASCCGCGVVACPACCHAVVPGRIPPPPPSLLPVQPFSN